MQKFDGLKESPSMIFTISTLVELLFALTMPIERCLKLPRSHLSVIKRDANTATTIQLPYPRELLDFPRFLFKRLNDNSMETKLDRKPFC
jgi:hypothetical protein